MKTEYMVITVKDSDELVRWITMALGQGWKLQGGVSVAHVIGSINVFAQAMIREVGDAEEIVE